MPNISNPVPIGPHWLDRRQLGLPVALGSGNLESKQKYNYSDSFLLHKSDNHGAIFSLEYNPEGTVLVAATERKNVLLFDPLRCVPMTVIRDAHDDCVNSIKFIDSNYFATCSDDRTVSIWDMRNLSSRLFNLTNHSNWVKSIEYSEKDKVLLSSGFDGSIYTWGWTAGTITRSTKVFSVNGLMRSRLSNDATKLILSTAGGYLIVVHNLNLLTIKTDLYNFKPNIYRLMQLSQTFLHRNGEGTNLFRGLGKRNKIEFISDFPENNTSEIISSVQVHPEGNCVFSRNISQDEVSEWSCVHVIEECERSSSDSDENMQVGWPTVAPMTQRPTNIMLPQATSAYEQEDLISSPNDVWEAVVAINEVQRGRTRSSRDNTPNTSRRLNIEYREENGELRNLRTQYEMNETVRLQTDSDVSFSEERGASNSRARGIELVVPIGVFRSMRGRGSSMRRHNVLALRISEENAASSTTNRERNSSGNGPFLKLKANKDIHQNYKRLLYYIQEPNVSLGFIKECSFSPDGRVICSPFGASFRLLAFSPEVLQPWQCVPEKPPAPLHVIWNKGDTQNNDEAVVSTKFSVLDNNLVVGTLSGSISIYYPFR